MVPTAPAGFDVLKRAATAAMAPGARLVQQRRVWQEPQVRQHQRVGEVAEVQQIVMPPATQSKRKLVRRQASGQVGMSARRREGLASYQEKDCHEYRSLTVCDVPGSTNGSCMLTNEARATGSKESQRAAHARMSPFEAVHDPADAHQRRHLDAVYPIERAWAPSQPIRVEPVVPHCARRQLQACSRTYASTGDNSEPLQAFLHAAGTGAALMRGQ